MAESETKNRPSLSKVLFDCVNESITPRNEQLVNNRQRVIDRVINPILRRIAELDDRFHAEELDARSCYVALQYATDPYEFDCVLKLGSLTSAKSLKTDSGINNSVFLDSSCCDNPYVAKSPGYGFVIVDKNTTLLHDLISGRDDSVHSEQMLVEEGFLCPIKVMSVFHSLLEGAVQALEDEHCWDEEPTVFEVQVSRKDSALTLTALLTGEVFTIHLLPGVPFSNNWPETIRRWGPASAVRPNPWLTSMKMREIMEDYVVFPGPRRGIKDPRLWAVCFYCSERQLCQLADENSTTVHDEARLLLEYLCVEDEKVFLPMNPRLLRMVFLQQCMQFPHEMDWSPKRLGRAFVDLFLAVIAATKSGSCPHFFIPHLNMLGHLGSSDLKQVSRHLRAVLNDIVENPTKTKFLPRRTRKLGKNRTSHLFERRRPTVAGVE